ncbi:MAG: hypothetical protein LBT49_01420 [Prevotellaceae bacterium]|nr:hypothetical protein [Prevotellaceae bacterium]
MKTAKHKQQPATRTSRRQHRKMLAFNDAENEVIRNFCIKYKISNQSKFFREAIVSAILRKLDEDHPKLF